MQTNSMPYEYFIYPGFCYYRRLLIRCRHNLLSTSSSQFRQHGLIEYCRLCNESHYSHTLLRFEIFSNILSLWFVSILQALPLYCEIGYFFWSLMIFCIKSLMSIRHRGSVPQSEGVGRHVLV